MIMEKMQRAHPRGRGGLTDPMKKERDPKPRRDKKRIRLSRTAMAAVRHLRSLPQEDARFTLKVSQEGTPHSMTVIANGRGPDSTYWIYQSAKPGPAPEWLPPASTYVVSTETDMDTALCMFADSPSLWSGAESDALDLPNEPYSEEAED